MKSKATTPEAYLAELPEDRRAALEMLRKVILKNIDKDIVEEMAYGMIAYMIPHSVYPPGNHGNPELGLLYTAISSQKNNMVFYFDSFVGDGKTSKENADWFRAEWAKTGKKLDMGMVCIRFKKIEDLPLDLIGRAIKRVSAKTYVEFYVGSLGPEKRSASRVGKPAAAKKSGPAKKPAAKKK